MVSESLSGGEPSLDYRKVESLTGTLQLQQVARIVGEQLQPDTFTGCMVALRDWLQGMQPMRQ